VKYLHFLGVEILKYLEAGKKKKWVLWRLSRLCKLYSDAIDQSVSNLTEAAQPDIAGCRAPAAPTVDFDNDICRRLFGRVAGRVSNGNSHGLAATVTSAPLFGEHERVFVPVYAPRGILPSSRLVDWRQLCKDQREPPALSVYYLAKEMIDLNQFLFERCATAHKRCAGLKN
jgi:hypothetical protein